MRGLLEDIRCAGRGEKVDRNKNGERDCGQQITGQGNRRDFASRSELSTASSDRSGSFLVGGTADCKELTCKNQSLSASLSSAFCFPPMIMDQLGFLKE